MQNENHVYMPPVQFVKSTLKKLLLIYLLSAIIGQLTFIITHLGFATMHKDVKWVPLSLAIDILSEILKHNIIAWGDCLS